MKPIIDHVQITVKDMAVAVPFYDNFLPLLGFDLKRRVSAAIEDHDFQARCSFSCIFLPNYTPTSGPPWPRRPPHPRAPRGPTSSIYSSTVTNASSCGPSPTWNADPVAASVARSITVTESEAKFGT